MRTAVTPSITRWVWLAWLLAAELWDYDASRDLASRALRSARETGALDHASHRCWSIGRPCTSSTGSSSSRLALRGGGLDHRDHRLRAREDHPVRPWPRCAATRLRPRASSRRVGADASARGEGRMLGSAAYGIAVLNNGLGRYDVALASAQNGCEHDDPGFYGWSLSELIEAAVRIRAAATSRATALCFGSTNASWRRAVTGHSDSWRVPAHCVSRRRRCGGVVSRGHRAAGADPDRRAHRTHSSASTANGFDGERRTDDARNAPPHGRSDA